MRASGRQVYAKELARSWHRIREMNPDTAFRQDVTIKHVLCPVDFSDQSQRALSHAVVIAAKFNVAATLLHVYEEATFAPPGEDPPLATSTSKRRRAEAEERLESCAQQ